MKVRHKPAQANLASAETLAGLGVRLQHLRTSCGITQLGLAEILGVGQTALSHQERRDDIKLSSLHAYIEALGGTLHIAATFPNVDPVSLVGQTQWVVNESLTPQSNGTNEQDEQFCLPNILGPKQAPPSRDIIFSIRPTHAKKILDGTKTVELRRRFAGGILPGTLAFIYTTSPTSALTGFAHIQDVQRLTVPDLWARHRSAACLGKADFEDYFSGLDQGYAIMLGYARSFNRPVSLSELRQRFGFEPPQSYRYTSPGMRDLVEHDRSQATN
jgi:predicted transcriptional regulator/transcriptional regulator with XRE-family HTH domain